MWAKNPPKSKFLKNGIQKMVYKKRRMKNGAWKIPHEKWRTKKGKFFPYFWTSCLWLYNLPQNWYQIQCLQVELRNIFSCGALALSWRTKFRLPDFLKFELRKFCFMCYFCLRRWVSGLESSFKKMITVEISCWRRKFSINTFSNFLAWCESKYGWCPNICVCPL